MRSKLCVLGVLCLISLPAACLSAEPVEKVLPRTGRPNILLAIADDQSWPHTGAYGDSAVRTPAFDRVARQGVLFTHAFCPASQCSPSRAALLTGRNIWQLEEAGTQTSLFPAKFQVYTELLAQAGYHVGYTGKPWGPGNWRDAGRKQNPAGKEFNRHRLKPPTSQISPCDYAANFAEFLEARPPGAPFCFWFGCNEPHRDYETGSAIRSGKRVEDVSVPPFYPDNQVVRGDLLDYRLEIEWFDRHLDQMLGQLQRCGELENTLVVVTADNGMPFPRAKATLYEAGTRVPLAIQWLARIPARRVVDDLVSFIDLAPTFLEATGLRPPPAMTGRSLLGLLTSGASGWVDPERDWVVLGKERHNHARPDNVGYPTRAIRTRQYLYIHNLKPDRWPMGDPPGYYCHTKMLNPTKEFILERQQDPAIRPIYEITYAKRQAEELYDVETDPHCLHNLADDPPRAAIVERLRSRLNTILREQGDPRVTGFGDIFESYPYYGPMQPSLGGFKEPGRYNPAFLPPGHPAARKNP
jgi:N-sulfoglucosamine sulfohydrolase